MDQHFFNRAEFKSFLNCSTLSICLIYDSTTDAFNDYMFILFVRRRSEASVFFVLSIFRIIDIGLRGNLPIVEFYNSLYHLSLHSIAKIQSVELNFLYNICTQKVAV